MKAGRFLGRITDTGGMTMMEVMFAGVILLGAIMVMMSMFETAIDILNFTTTRSLATQIANEQMEDMRSMDYEQVYNKTPDQWPNDPNLDTSSNPPKYLDGGVWRDIVTTSTAGGLDMERSITRKNIDFLVRNYVLWVSEGSTATVPQAYKRLIVKISWTTPGRPGEVALTTNYAKQDTREPRPSVTIIGVRSTNYNYFIGAPQDTTMGIDDSIRGPITGEAITPIVFAQARANSAKATGINRVEFTLYNPDGSVAIPASSVTVTDTQGFYRWNLSTTSRPDGMGYLIKAEAFDSLGNSDIATTRVNIDNTPPAAPANLDTTDTSAFRMNVTWDWSANTSDAIPYVDRFIIKRKKGAESFVQRAAMPGTARAFKDADLVNGATYTYQLLAVDAAGNTAESAPKEKGKTPRGVSDTYPPTAPSGLSGGATSWKAVDLTWTPSIDTTGTLWGYFVYGSDSSGATIVGELLAPIGVNPEFYQDTGLKGGKTYMYTAQAFDYEGNVSGLSNQITVTTPLR